MSSFPISVTQVQVESHLFPPFVKAPGSKGIFFLGGAGVRGVDIEGKFRKYTAIGVYLEDCAIPSLAPKWKGKTAEELMDSVEFFRDIVTGPFEKFTRVTMILPLTGRQYAGKVAENCIAYWKEVGRYSDADKKAIEKFLEIFRDENFPPDASVLFTQSPLGFSKDSSIPEVGNVVIENKPISEAVLESIIGKKGVSPAARKSLAVRLPDLLNEFDSVIADHKKLEASETVAVIEAPEKKKVLNGVEALVHKEVNGATVIEAPEEKKVLNGGEAMVHKKVDGVEAA